MTECQRSSAYAWTSLLVIASSKGALLSYASTQDSRHVCETDCAAFWL